MGCFTPMKANRSFLSALIAIALGALPAIPQAHASNPPLDTAWPGRLTRYLDYIFELPNSGGVGNSIRKTHNDLVYAPGVKLVQDGVTSTRDLWLDVWQPPERDPEDHRPLVIWVHGGGFKNGGEEVSPQGPMPEFVRRGYVFASIKYRLMDLPLGDKYATADALAAVRFFRMQALLNPATFKIDPNRIIVCGASAGGITSLMAGISGDSALALGLLYGNLAYSNQPSWIAAACAQSGAFIDPAYAAANLGPNDTPIFTDVHGTVDKTVPYALAVASASLINTMPNLEMVFFPVEGAGHGLGDVIPYAQIWGEYTIPVLFEKMILADPPVASMGVAQIPW